MVARPVAACQAPGPTAGPGPAQPSASSTLPGRPSNIAGAPALARVRALNLALRGGRSATATLESWCAEHRLAAEPRIVARLVRRDEKAPTPEQRRRLQVAGDEPVCHRRVELACGGHVLSEADNWYVPGRLTAEINRVLAATDIPFGRAVESLRPYRRPLAAQVCWPPLLEDGRVSEVDGAGVPRILFQHRALLYGADHQPLSEVDESYLGELLTLAGGAPPKEP